MFECYIYCSRPLFYPLKAITLTVIFFFFFPRVTRCRSCLYQVYVFLSLFLLIIFITFALIHFMLQSNRSVLCCMLTKGFYVLSVMLYPQRWIELHVLLQGLKEEFGFYLGFIWIFSILKTHKVVWKLFILIEAKGDSSSLCETQLQKPFPLIFPYIPVEKKKPCNLFEISHVKKTEHTDYCSLLHLFEMMLLVSAAALWALIFLFIFPGLNLECCLASELFFKAK